LKISNLFASILRNVIDSIDLENRNLKLFYRTSHYIWNCAYNVIFCPKYRYKVLVPPIDSRMKDLVLQKQTDYGYEVLEQEVMPDHVHLLLEVNPILSVLQMVNKIKGWTSYSLRKEFSNLRSLPSLWSPSKFISSCGAVTLEVVTRYIEGQKI